MSVAVKRNNISEAMKVVTDLKCEKLLQNYLRSVRKFSVKVPDSFMLPLLKMIQLGTFTIMLVKLTGSVAGLL